MGGGRAQLGKGVKARRERNQEPPARLNRPGSQHGCLGPGIPLLVGRRSSQKETEEAAHLLAGLGHLKRQPVWSGQLSGSDQTSAGTGR